MAASLGISYGIKEWTCSYYVQDQKIWLYGALLVSPHAVIFHDEKRSFDEVVLRFDDFTEVKRETSTFLFRAVTIATKYGKKHWFGSFSNRDVAFCFIEHFWKERLIVPARIRGDEGRGTNLGRELLRIAHDSEKTLSTASETLNYQGEQLDAAARLTTVIDHDLTVAERLVEGLDSWLGKWSATVSLPPLAALAGEEDEKKFQVLYRQKPKEPDRLGFLRVSKGRSTVEVLDSKMKVVHTFSEANLSEVFVTTPWECSLVSRRVGQPDVRLDVTSARLAQILKLIEPVHRHRIHYDGSSLPDGGGEFIGGNHSNDDEKRSDTLQESSTERRDSIGGEKVDVISQEEISDLNHILGNLKSMALDVQNEEDQQNKKIEKLSETVESTTHRIHKNVGRINKLL